MQPETLPRPGVTVLAKTYELLPGGKGANQAHACAMASRGDVEKNTNIKTDFVGAVGNDAFGVLLKKAFHDAGVGTAGLSTHDSLPTACAAVVVDSNGENQIAVGSGANNSVRAGMLADTSSFSLEKNDVLLLQTEIPVEEVCGAIDAAHQAGALSVLNVAPSAPVPKAVLERLDFLIVNEHEAIDVYESIMPLRTPRDSPDLDPLAVSRVVAQLTGIAVIVTLGSEGAAACLSKRPNDDSGKHISNNCDIISVDPPSLLDGEVIKDTTGAGDAFCGAFVHALAAGFSLRVCLQRASVAGTLGCLAVGARTAVPDGDVISKRQNDAQVTANWGAEGETSPYQALLLFNAPATAWTRQGRKKVERETN